MATSEVIGKESKFQMYTAAEIRLVVHGALPDKALGLASSLLYKIVESP